jgi:Holliday junction DNA helicase RuvA
MIHYLKGVVIESSPLEIVIDVNGVGYSVQIPITTAEKIPPNGENCELFIHPVYREDSASLYGFIDRNDRDFFRLLIEKVSGIGPRIALSILSKMSVAILQQAIFNQDTSLLSKCPGIGKKTAERLVIELKDKVNSSLTSQETPNVRTHSFSTSSAKHQDAVASLITLGYKTAEADKRVAQAIQKLGIECSVEVLIKEALS